MDSADHATVWYRASDRLRQQCAALPVDDPWRASFQAVATLAFEVASAYGERERVEVAQSKTPEG